MPASFGSISESTRFFMRATNKSWVIKERLLQLHFSIWKSTKRNAKSLMLRTDGAPIKAIFLFSNRSRKLSYAFLLQEFRSQGKGEKEHGKPNLRYLSFLRVHDFSRWWRRCYYLRRRF